MMIGHRVTASLSLSLLAGCALAAVLSGLAVYSIEMDRRSSEATARAERSTRLASALTDMKLQLLELERVGTSFILSPTVELRSEFDLLVSEILTQIDHVSALQTQSERRSMEEIKEKYLPQLAIVQEFFDALLVGASYTGPIPDASVVAEIEAVIDGPVRARRESSSETMIQLRSWQQQRVRTTAVVFVGGLLIVAFLMKVLRDTSVRAARAQADIDHLRKEVLTDSLTGLGNHRALQEALRSPTRPATGSLVVIDIDRFKEVNDTRGHAEGDKILRLLARLIAERFPGAGFRMGGDEFAILASERRVEDRLTRMLADFSAATPGVSGSAGESDWDDPGAELDLHLAQADAALRLAKKERGERVVRFSDVEHLVGGVRSARRSEALRKLLADRRGLSAVFQPIWRLDGSLCAFEALTRIDPALGFSGPEEAFDVAQQDGRSLELDHLACEVITSAAGGLPRSALLFINISPASIADRRFSVSAIESLVRGGGRTPSDVVVEITERSSVPARILAERIDELRASGFQVALDDVGVGNSGLETLRAISVDWVKIDRSIVVSASRSTNSMGLLKAIVAFAAEVDATLVAEGIEQAGELDVVAAISSSGLPPDVQVVVQGFLFGAPAPAGQATGIPNALKRSAA